MLATVEVTTVDESPPAPAAAVEAKVEPDPPPAAPPAAQAETGKSTTDIVFDTPDGPKNITFTRVPLGMTFSKKVPISIKSIGPGTHAEELGVQAGWAIKSIAGTETEALEFDSVYTVLKDAVATLSK